MLFLPHQLLISDCDYVGGFRLKASIFHLLFWQDPSDDAATVSSTFWTLFYSRPSGTARSTLLGTCSFCLDRPLFPISGLASCSRSIARRLRPLTTLPLPLSCSFRLYTIFLARHFFQAREELREFLLLALS